MVKPETAQLQVAFRRAIRANAPIIRVYPGAFARKPDQDVAPETVHALRVFAARENARSGVVSGISAAVLHGIPLRRAVLNQPVSVTRRTAGTASPWITVSRAALHEHEVIELYGMQVTSIERTLRDLAGVVSEHDLVAAADGVLRLGGELPSPVPGARHVQKLRSALAKATGRAESFAESYSRSILLDAGIDLLQQVDLFDRVGRFVARADFADPIGVLGEFDGRVKYDRLAGSVQAASNVIMREKDRENALRELGWDIPRWGWADLRRPESVVRRIQRSMKKAEKLPVPQGTWKLSKVRALTPPDWSELFGLATDAERY